MAALPSFVELMSSLGLATDTRSPSPGTQLPRASSRSPSRPDSPLFRVPSKQCVEREKSPAIIVSQYEASDSNCEFKRRTSSGNIKAARFSPYSSTPRRGSMPSLSDSKRDSEHSRASSSRRSSAGSEAPPVPPLPGRRSRHESLEPLNVVVASCTPISSFARRRSPHSSPTSPTFPQHRARSASAELPSPVMLPTLPPMLAESFAVFSFPTPVAENCSNAAQGRKSKSPLLSPMALDSDSEMIVKHHQAGLRISSFHRQVAPIA